MQCATKKFLASQALYGIMIAYPEMAEDDMIKKALRMADKIMKAERKHWRKKCQED